MKPVINFLVLSLAFALPTLTYSQFRILKDIDNGDGFGLRTAYNGHIYGETAYFIGYQDGFTPKLYKTDGTSGGTIPVTTSQASNYDEANFLSNKVAFKDRGSYKLMSLPSEQVTSISKLRDKRIGASYDWNGDRVVIFGSSTEDVYVTDGTEEGTNLVYTFNERQFNLFGSAGKDHYYLFNSNPFADGFEPFAISKSDYSVIDIKDMIADAVTAEKVRYAYGFQEYLFLQIVEEGIVKNYLYNTDTQMLKPYQFVDDFIEGFDQGDHYMLVFGGDVIRINRADDSNFVAYSKVEGITTIHRTEFRIFFINENWGITSVNVNTGEFKEYSNTDIGFGYLYPRMTVHDNKLYYLTQRTDEQTRLRMQDLNTGENFDIGIAGLRRGLVIENALFTLNDNVYLSRYVEDTGHELFILDLSLSNDQIEEATTSLLINTLADHTLYINEGKELIGSIYNNNGQLVNITSFVNGQGDISDLSTGIYFIKWNNEKVPVEKFVKQ